MWGYVLFCYMKKDSKSEYSHSQNFTFSFSTLLHMWCSLFLD